MLHYWRPQMFPMRCLALNLAQTPIEKTRQREGMLTRKWRFLDEYIFSTLIELAKPSFLLEGLKKMIYSGYDALTEQWRFKDGQAFSVWRLLRRSLLWQGKILKPNTVDHETINVGKTYPRPTGRVSSKRSYKPAFSGSTDHKHHRK